jgi:hypothetical protein
MCKNHKNLKLNILYLLHIITIVIIYFTKQLNQKA